MAAWIAFPHTGEFSHDAASVKKHWARLHLGDAEPLPSEREVLAAWALFHNGEFRKAAEAGLALGSPGLSVAHKATCIYATYLETKESTKLDLFSEVAERARTDSEANPDNPSAWYYQGYALGRYGQGISVAKALAQGLGTRVKQALEQTIVLQPRHAEAHIALGAFHAEVIDKVGSLIGGMTYGARKDVSLRMFQAALALHPQSAIAHIEYANGLLMLEGDAKMAEATQLYEQAARAPRTDAMEWLDAELASAELADD